jgi:hypothetical protein
MNRARRSMNDRDRFVALYKCEVVDRYRTEVLRQSRECVSPPCAYQRFFGSLLRGRYSRMGGKARNTASRCCGRAPDATACIGRWSRSARQKMRLNMSSHPVYFRCSVGTIDAHHADVNDEMVERPQQRTSVAFPQAFSAGRPPFRRATTQFLRWWRASFVGP